MSKIYEALVRAEQERNQADGKHPDRATPNKFADRELKTPSANSGVALLPDEEVVPTPAAQAALPIVDLSTPAPASPTPAAMPSMEPTIPVAPRSAIFTRAAMAAEPAVAATPAEEPVVDETVIHDRRATDHATEFDIGSIGEYAWNPSIDYLPALEERGRSVEQFRSLRSRMHEFRDLNTLKSVLVSSGLPQEGKSFIAANLAISFARHKASRVLLIDGDMRRSSLHQLLGTRSEPGLAEYLAGSAKLKDIMQVARPLQDGMPLPNGLSSLTFIGAGKDTNTAADLSGNYRFDELIKTLGPHFDWIIVDSSPVNLVADGVNLARACDGVLIVARAGVTKFEAAQRALTELKASNILGFVLNAVTKTSVTGGYYGYDSYDTYDSYDSYQTKPK